MSFHFPGLRRFRRYLSLAKYYSVDVFSDVKFKLRRLNFDSALIEEDDADIALHGLNSRDINLTENDDIAV